MIFINMISMKHLFLEGRYDSLVTTLSSKLLKVIKDSYAATSTADGKFGSTKIFYKQGETVPEIEDDTLQPNIYFEEVENSIIPVEFYLQLKLQWIEGLNDLKYGGDAYNDSKRNSDEPPLIEIRFQLDPAEYPRILSEIAMNLRDTLRHEIEHVTQSGWNTIDGKYIASDAALRKKIEAGNLPPARYFTLPKEIPAMIQGLYFKAKKSKQPFKTVVDEYLSMWVDNETITPQEKENILTAWRSYLPKLAIRQEL
jgi:hypothetical protein